MQQADPKDPQPKKKIKKRILCPFVRSPHKDCYFLDMNSNKISMAVYYCQNHFTKCEIYKRLTPTEKSKSNDNKTLTRINRKSET
jgi:hypothetical protein